MLMRWRCADGRTWKIDALVLAGAPGPGKDAFGTRDAKAGDPAAADCTETDPRVLLMLSEASFDGVPMLVGKGRTRSPAPGCSSRRRPVFWSVAAE